MKKKKFVLHVIDSISGGGAEKIVRDLVKKNNSKINFIQDYYELSPHKFSIIKFIIRTFYLFKRIKFLKKKGYQIIFHAHLTKAIYLSAFARLYKCKIVITEHNTWNKRRKFKFLIPFEYYIYHNAEFVISISNAVKDNLLKWLRNKNTDNTKFKVIYNGISDNYIKSKKKILENKKVVKLLIVGSLTHQKGIDLSLNLLRNLKFENWTCNIVGDGPEKQNLIKLTKKFNLENRVQYKGYIENINDIYSDSDILLITSRWEGFGLVAVEALLAGLVILWSKVPGLNEVLESCDTAIKFDLLDQTDFEKSLKLAINKLKNQPFTSEKSHKHGLLFSTDRMAKGYNTIYQGI